MLTHRRIMSNPITRNYIVAAIKFAKYCKVDVPAPPQISNRYNKAIEEYREYLDTMGVRMPFTRVYFDKDDMTTWKYKDVSIHRNRLGNITSVTEVLNEKWEGFK